MTRAESIAATGDNAEGDHLPVERVPCSVLLQHMEIAQYPARGTIALRRVITTTS